MNISTSLTLSTTLLPPTTQTWTCSRHNHHPYRTKLSRSISRFSTPTNLHGHCHCLLLSTQVLGVVALHGLLARCASNVADLSPSFIYTLLSSLGASIAGFGALHCQARESPPGLERPRVGKWYGARRARRRVLWCAGVHYRPIVRASLSESCVSSSVSNARSLIPIMERNVALNGLSGVTAAELDWLVRRIHPSPAQSHLLPGQNRYLSTSHDLTSSLLPIAYTSSLRFRCSSPRSRRSSHFHTSRRRPKCSSATRNVAEQTGDSLHYSKSSLHGLWYATSPLSGLGYFFRD
jgi:hypothetical protein